MTDPLAITVCEAIARFQADLARIPQVGRGKVWCHTCGRTAPAGAECFRTGWPKCCGQTMSLDSPEERARRGGRAR